MLRSPTIILHTKPVAVTVPGRKRGPKIVFPKAFTLVDLWADAQKARDEWLAHYRSIPKYGRTTKQAYKDAGLWRRYQNRLKKYNEAHLTARNSLPS